MTWGCGGKRAYSAGKWEECEQDLDARLERAASIANVCKQINANVLLCYTCEISLIFKLA